ncbi:MAG: hypothetical protein MJE68_08465, partial [Proteobacteria bacterium]|nr:hypothetical protein [Pseudomonadota bacterium]
MTKIIEKPAAFAEQLGHDFAKQIDGGKDLKCTNLVYCHRKFRPLSKPRLWYNTILLKGVSDGETKTKNLHPRV